MYPAAKWQQKLSIRITAIFIASGLLTIALFLLIVTVAKGEFEEENQQQIYITEVLAKALVEEVGVPPSEEKMRQFIKAFPSELYVSGPDFQWRSGENSIEKSDRVVVAPLTENLSFVAYQGIKGLEYISSGYAFTLFEKEQVSFIGRYQKELMALAALGVLVLTLLAVNKSIAPLYRIRAGANKIRLGNLSYQIPRQPTVEFSQLAESINAMSNALNEQLDAKQELLLSISHELKTPITRAKIQLDLIEPDSLKKSLQDDIDELSQLVTHILETERLNKGHQRLNLEHFSLSEFMQDMQYEIGHHSPQVKWQICQQPCYLEGDPLRLELVLKNLISNAIRHGKEKPIRVILDSEADGTIALSVQDQGEGISPQHLEKITDPFYRADSSRQRTTGGFGLGLYLTKSIVEAHGARLNINSVLQKGTKVTVRFPAQLTETES